MTQQTDAQRLDGYETASLNEIIAQLESCEYECIAGPLYNNIAFIELKKRASQLDAANQTIAELQAKKEPEAWKQQNKILREGLRKQYQQNQLMRDFLETLKERAKNDIAIRSGKGQRVGNLTFASLQEARVVRGVCEALTKVHGLPTRATEPHQ